MPRIFITGAASGIGKATSELFAANNWNVAVADVNFSAASELAGELGANAVPFAVDVRDVDSLERALAEFCGSSGGLDVLFNCAGVLDMRRHIDTPLERQKFILDVNVNGVLNGIDAALPYLRRREDSRIITMSSTSAIYGIPEQSAYTASKFAVRGLTESINIEFEALGVWVCDIMVAFVETPMVLAAEYKPKSLELLGIDVKPGDVAETVWKSLTEKRVHWFVNKVAANWFDEINQASLNERREAIKAATGC